MKTKLSELEAEAEEPTNRKAQNRILLILLATSTMQFSLDNKQRSHKPSQCSSPNSVGLIFTRSYRSTLLIKPGLKEIVTNLIISAKRLS